jgi:Uma2 family endonuclease
MAMSNEFFQLERSKEGEIIVTSSTGDDTRRANSEIIRQLGNWWRARKRGAVYGSSTGFFLPDSSNMSPDAAYVSP